MTPGDTVCRARAHAKLNLSLRVLGREATGFHQIDTLFCALDLADDVEITLTSRDITLDVAAPADQQDAAPDLGPTDANLAVRAARLLFDFAGHAGGAHIRLVKRIPAGAGLGGGSSDAAAVLTALNGLLATPLAAIDLMTLGARLGSDVPFFLSGAPLAIGRGRGERLQPLPPLSRAAVLLAVPPERISTAAAYAALADSRAGAHYPPPDLTATHLRGWEDVIAIARNDFEPIVFEMHPRIGRLRTELEECGARLARLTGTGSVVFGVFDDEDAASAAARRVSAAHPDVTMLLTHTRAD